MKILKLDLIYPGFRVIDVHTKRTGGMLRMIKKGDCFKTTYSNQIYVVAGKWLGDIVLAPTDKSNEECMIYEASEIEELLEEGKLVREKRCQK